MPTCSLHTPPSPCPGPQNFLPISKICLGLFSDLVLPRADDSISIYVSRPQRLSKSCCLKAAWGCMSLSIHICAHTMPGAWTEKGTLGWRLGLPSNFTMSCSRTQGNLKIPSDFDLGHYEVLFKVGNGTTIG